MNPIKYSLNNDRRFVLLDPKDNILVCCKQVDAEEIIVLEGAEIRIETTICIGHKIARNNIRKTEKIIRYGASIGSAISNIAMGQHVHLHNMKSDYIPSHTRKSRVEVTVEQ